MMEILNEVESNICNAFLIESFMVLCKECTEVLPKKKKTCVVLLNDSKLENLCLYV